VVLGGVGGELDNDVVVGEEMFERSGASDTVFLEDGVGNAGGEGGDGDIERAEEGDHFLGDGPKAVKTDAAAKEALGDGLHAVFPSSIPVHSNIPVGGSAHGGEDEEKTALGNGTTDGVSPVGDEQSVFDELTGDEFFYAPGEVGDVAELAGLAHGEVLGQGRATPGAEEGIRLMF